MGNGRRDLGGRKRGRVGGVGGEVKTFLLNAVLNGLGGSDLLPELLEVRGAHGYGAGRKHWPSAGSGSSTHWHSCSRLAWEPTGSTPCPASTARLPEAPSAQPGPCTRTSRHHLGWKEPEIITKGGQSPLRQLRRGELHGLTGKPPAPGEHHRAVPGQEKTPAQGAGGPILTQPSPTPPKLLWLLMQPGPKP